MLSQDDLSNLYQIISDDSKTFESIGTSFQKTFAKPDQFKVGITIWFLLKDNLINISQRLASFYIYYEMYKTETFHNIPFIPIILETLETTQNNVEKKFLIDFITVGQIKYTKSTVKNFIEENKQIDTIQVPDLKNYWNAFENEREKFSNVSEDWVRPVLFETEEINKNLSRENQPPFNFSNLSTEEFSFNHFEPNYMTFYPNNSYQFFEDEPIWITPGLNFDFIWDFTLSQEQNVSKIFIKLKVF